MKFIKGKNRDQIEFYSLNDQVEDNNEVRLIDLFVDTLRLGDYGFKTDFIENGRPTYHPSDLLKLYLYGYLTFNINNIEFSILLTKINSKNT